MNGYDTTYMDIYSCALEYARTPLSTVSSRSGMLIESARAVCTVYSCRMHGRMQNPESGRGCCLSSSGVATALRGTGEMLNSGCRCRHRHGRGGGDERGAPSPRETDERSAPWPRETDERGVRSCLLSFGCHRPGHGRLAPPAMHVHMQHTCKTNE